MGLHITKMATSCIKNNRSNSQHGITKYFYVKRENSTIKQYKQIYMQQGMQLLETSFDHFVIINTAMNACFCLILIAVWGV